MKGDDAVVTDVRDGTLLRRVPSCVMFDAGCARGFKWSLEGSFFYLTGGLQPRGTNHLILLIYIYI